MAVVDLAAKWRNGAYVTWRAITEKLDARQPDPADYQWPEPAPGGEDPDPLLDSSRTYVEQVDRFKAHQGKPTGRKRRTRNGGA